MRNKIFYSLVFLLVALLVIPSYAQAGKKPGKAKYIFYFIGDGMGINQVIGTEMFLAEMEGEIGIKPLNFTQFPVNTFVTTYSATNSVTCSAAAGTALACGEKTKNRTIGMDKEHENPLYSIAVTAKAQGMKVGIATNNSVNHATPACFYAHQPDRNNVYEIARELPVAGFDFYAGAGFILPGEKKAEIFSLFTENGYTIARGFADYRQKSGEAQKMILIQPEGVLSDNLPYTIDREPGDMTLEEITEGAIDFLTKDSKKGFFVMIECGLIDWACHSNDAGAAFNEVADFQKSIQKAIDFYHAHPEETLIVVTADHETGGIALGTGRYELNLKALGEQKVSKSGLSKKISALRDEKSGQVSWEEVKQVLSDNLGLWTKVKVKEQYEKELMEKYKKAFQEGDRRKDKSLYAEDEPLASKAVDVLNRAARINWGSGGHSAGAVPLFVLGQGADLFSGKLDNTDIPKKMEQAMSGKESMKLLLSDKPH